MTALWNYVAVLPVLIPVANLILSKFRLNKGGCSDDFQGEIIVWATLFLDVFSPSSIPIFPRQVETCGLLFQQQFLCMVTWLQCSSAAVIVFQGEVKWCWFHCTLYVEVTQTHVWDKGLGMFLINTGNVCCLCSSRDRAALLQVQRVQLMRVHGCKEWVGKHSSHWPWLSTRYSSDLTALSKLPLYLLERLISPSSFRHFSQDEINHLRW